MGATITILILDAPHVQNIILNLLAIGVVLEIDNMFAPLILSPYQQERTQTFVDDAENQGNVGISWFSFNFTRFIGISASLIMSFVTRNIQTIQESTRFGCNNEDIIVLIVVFSSHFVILGYGILNIYSKVKVYTIREATFRGVLDIFTNLCCLSMLGTIAFYLLTITFSKFFVSIDFTTQLPQFLLSLFIIAIFKIFIIFIFFKMV